MGVLYALLMPRGLRKVLHPLDSAIYSAKRRRRVLREPYYTHSGCPIRHRSMYAATHCRNWYDD